MSTQEQAPVAETARLDTDIVTKIGEPFKTSNAAVLAAKGKGISHTHIPVKIGKNAWALREKGATAGTPVTTEAPEPTEPEEAPAPKTKYYKIIIDEQQNSDQNGDIFTSDGVSKQYQIQRGKEVIVPEGVVNVLKESIITHLEYKDSDIVERHIPRFALRILETVEK